MKVFYVDPMSYHNLALYDRALLTNLDSSVDIVFFCNERYELQDRGSLRKIYSYSGKNIFWKAVSYISSQLKLLAAIRREKPDILHIQWVKIPRLDAVFIRAAKYLRPGLRVIITSHNAFGHDPEEREYHSLKKIYSLADKIIVHTQTTAQELISADTAPEKITIVPHGLLNLNELIPAMESESAYSLPVGTVKFGVLGTMDIYKGTDLCLAAWTGSLKLSASNDALLVIAGSNNGITFTEELPPNVLLIERLLNNYEFNKLLNDVDIIVMPYRKISQSGLMLSALKARKHIIVSDVGELTAPFYFGKIGWILKNNDVDSLRSMLEKVFEEVLERGLPEVDESVWNAIEEHYSWHAAGRITSALYKALTETPPNSAAAK